MCRVASVLCVCLLVAHSVGAQTTASGSPPRYREGTSRAAALPGVSIHRSVAPPVPGVRTSDDQ